MNAQPQRKSPPSIIMALPSLYSIAMLFLTTRIPSSTHVLALSQSPTSRYIKEMGRLLQQQRTDHNGQLNVVASPTKVDEDIDTRTDYTLFEDNVDVEVDTNNFQYEENNGWQQQYYDGEPSSLYQADGYDTSQQPRATARTSMFGIPTPPEEAPTVQQVVEQSTTATTTTNGFVANDANPQPPPTLDPYYQKQRELFNGYYAQNQTPNSNSGSSTSTAEDIKASESPSQPVVASAAAAESSTRSKSWSKIEVTRATAPQQQQQQQPRNDSELFDALNEQIEALDQQMQTTASTSFGEAVISDPTSPLSQFTTETETEPEWRYDATNGYYQVAEEDEVDYSFQQQYEYVDANLGSSYDPYQQEGYEDGEEESYDQYQSYVEPSSEVYTTGDAGQQDSTLDAENFALRQELERLAIEKKQAEDAAARATQQLQQEKKRLAAERLEQERIIEEQAEAARAQLKKALSRELAHYELRHQMKTAGQSTVSLAKYRNVPQLPNTNDVFELLELDYNNPPETPEELKKSFLKCAKKYHPDRLPKDATRGEREQASLNFAKINSAHQLLKKKLEQIEDNYCDAVMMGGSMYDNRSSHIRRSFSKGNQDDYGSVFSSRSNTYSSQYGPIQGGGQQQQQQGEYEQPQTQGGNNRGQARNPFRRRQRAQGVVRENCHVSLDDFPPF